MRELPRSDSSVSVEIRVSWCRVWGFGFWELVIGNWGCGVRGGVQALCSGGGMRGACMTESHSLTCSISCSISLSRCLTLTFSLYHILTLSLSHSLNLPLSHSHSLTLSLSHPLTFQSDLSFLAGLLRGGKIQHLHLSESLLQTGIFPRGSNNFSAKLSFERDVKSDSGWGMISCRPST